MCAKNSHRRWPKGTLWTNGPSVFFCDGTVASPACYWEYWNLHAKLGCKMSSQKKQRSHKTGHSKGCLPISFLIPKNLDSWECHWYQSTPLLHFPLRFTSGSGTLEGKAIKFPSSFFPPRYSGQESNPVFGCKWGMWQNPPGIFVARWAQKQVISRVK